MPGFHLNEMGEMVLDAIDDIGVVDVYDLASDIGKEYERIMDRYGTDAVSGLMPKIINTLELLEALATKNERENTTIEELREKIAQLESEKLEKAEFRRRFEKELELIEEQWRSETNELVDLVSSLQDENKRLVKQTQDLQSSSAQSSGLGASLTESIISMTNNELHSALSDTQVLQRLKEQIYKQRDELKQRERELQDKYSELEHVNIQAERLKASERDTRRRHKLMQAQVKTLCEERADFLAQLQDQCREINQLRKRLGLAEKENEDLVQSYDDNENDPNRPRYTTRELKELISERDELLTTIDSLNEQLAELKPAPSGKRMRHVSSSDDSDDDDVAARDDDDNEADDGVEADVDDDVAGETPPGHDAPVQGPLPYEPDDAPWKKSSESGIRKFFRKLFSDPSDGSNTFPKRSLATLSKMALSATPGSGSGGGCNEPNPCLSFAMFYMLAKYLPFSYMMYIIYVFDCCALIIILSCYFFLTQ
ncbi:RILP-like protein homolog [Drosophila sulfurigaster albostrigata]|uniref:RILP-like protein homolog n=1 Tax=Drosophila sulfurigaster albostrigata TaxID=89887 RepID=UPI002D218277|nr:RILP-like protein homolog [Drosophila sulfurigaster albostrigata]XP_062140298.1 RILP-like protein homolog [Drosophila sulfurigaster albostrigata]XP_062140299.1 RILP-like protein homolog [Drosophila sulfurigaster albostrigata]